MDWRPRWLRDWRIHPDSPVVFRRTHPEHTVRATVSRMDHSRPPRWGWSVYRLEGDFWVNVTHTFVAGVLRVGVATRLGAQREAWRAVRTLVCPSLAPLLEMLDEQ